MSKVKLGEVAIEHKETCKGNKDGYPIGFGYKCTRCTRQGPGAKRAPGLFLLIKCTRENSAASFSAHCYDTQAFVYTALSVFSYFTAKNRTEISVFRPVFILHIRRNTIFRDKA